MKADQFAYWLQGHFEIGAAATGGLDDGLSADQVTCILNHASLVMKCDWQSPTSKTHHFVTWVRGLLSGFTDGLPNEQRDLMRCTLNDVFAHEIDPSFESGEVTHQLLQEFHDTGRPPQRPEGPGSLPTAQTFRC